MFQTAPYPAPPYSNAFLDNYTLTDYEWRSPGKWAPLFTPPPTSVTHVVSQPLGLESAERLRGDRHQGPRRGHRRRLRPVAGRGVRARAAQRLHAGRKAGLGATYVNCPTLTLDRVNGAKVLADAKAGKIGHADADRALPARHRQGDPRVSARPELRHAAGRAGAARHAHRRHVAHRGERRLRAARHHVVLQPRAAGRSGRARSIVLLRLPPLHARRRSELAAVRLLHDPSRAAEVDRRDDRHRAHGRPPDDRDRARRQSVRLLDRAPGGRRRDHEPDGRLQQQHLAGRGDRARGHRQSLAARRRQGRQRRARASTADSRAR